MRVVIAGGGVAGSAAALALARTGHEVTVYESHEDPGGQVGSFLSLAANGLRALDALGCLAAVQRAGFAVPRQRMWSGRGRLLADVPRGRRASDHLMSITLMRADLVSVLRSAAAGAGASIVTGRPLTAADIRCLSADAELFVGADGIWSATRSALDPAAPQPRYAGLYTVSGVSSGLSIEQGAWNMMFASRGAFIWLQAPDRTTWWSAQVSAPPPDLAAAGPAALRELFRREDTAAAIIGATQAVHAATLHHVLAPVRIRQDGHVALIGDAAAPVGAGQGASMAIEDAVVLTQHVQRGAPVPAALAAFDQARRARVGKMARTAARNRDAKTAGPLAARLRELIMPVVFGRVYERATGWLYDFDPGELAAAQAVGSDG
ncbi:MAG TPA: NAD(P)/FAD-dependent oxidoreductase [Streptosporangiaceae bacterium]|nr:NAD(P)/FAD-dependent oxidoreductase [Streptosporangiaceae bacterium]